MSNEEPLNEPADEPADEPAAGGPVLATVAGIVPVLLGDRKSVV
jgi:hypothetical protein